MCEKPTQRSFAIGMTFSIAAFTSGKRRRPPVWKRSGSSSSTRIWLKEKPPGISRTGVWMR
jgi:hypothetical protein